MKDLVLLIKPASGLCNMRCEYCFYHDELKKSNEIVQPMKLMTIQTLEQIVKRAFEIADKKCSFVFQGGEPTLQGIEFYEEFESLLAVYNLKNVEVEKFIQTNGSGVTESHAEFFLKNSYYIGVSIDGNSDQHDKYRRFHNGKGTHSKVVEGISLLFDYGVDVSALVTVTENNASNGAELYRYTRSLGFKKIQFTKYISTDSSICLSAESWERFLKAVFFEYLKDISRGTRVSVREFDNLILLYLEKRTEICGGDGVCRCALTIESDGSVYPCDFYVSSEYKLGNVFKDSFENIYSDNKLRAFSARSVILPSDCKNCEYLNLCGNGCYRYRDENGKYLYCESYKNFFKFALPYLEKLSLLM